jgi:hypothetical protein
LPVVAERDSAINRRTKAAGHHSRAFCLNKDVKAAGLHGTATCRFFCLRKRTNDTKKYLKESIKFGDKELIVETGRVAKQADGSVVD